MHGEPAEKSWLSTLWAVREVDHLFARIGRYTRFVGYSKWSLLIITLLLVVSLIVWPLVTKDRSGLRVSFVAKKVATNQPPSSPVMSRPGYRGVGTNGLQYKINGVTATQKTPTLVLIEHAEAQMVRADGNWYSLTADRAEYQQDKKQIELFGNVTVIDGQATQFVTERATIEMEQNRIYGKEAISGNGNFGNILASGFEIRDNGNHIIFVGGAKQLRLTVDRSKKVQ